MIGVIVPYCFTCTLGVQINDNPPASVSITVLHCIQYRIWFCCENSSFVSELSSYPCDQNSFTSRPFVGLRVVSIYRYGITVLFPVHKKKAAAVHYCSLCHRNDCSEIFHTGICAHVYGVTLRSGKCRLAGNLVAVMLNATVSIVFRL